MPQEYGYFAINVSGRAMGKQEPAGSSFELTGITSPSRTNAIQAKISTEIAQDWKLGLRSKFDKKQLDEIVAAFKEGSGSPVKRLAAAFGKTLGVEVKHSDAIGPVGVDTGGGVEVSQTPFFFFSKWSCSRTTVIEGVQIKYQVKIEGRVHVGLSKRGWAEVGRRVGANVVRQFLQRAGAPLARLGAWVASSGALTVAFSLAGGVVGTFGLVALAGYLTRQAHRAGTAAGIEAWYVSAYSRKVFNLPSPSGYVTTNTFGNAPQLAGQMVQAGETDAVADARRTAQQTFHDSDYQTVSEAEILRRHRARLEQPHGGSTSLARHYLEQELRKRARVKLGLR